MSRNLQSQGVRSFALTFFQQLARLLSQESAHGSQRSCKGNPGCTTLAAPVWVVNAIFTFIGRTPSIQNFTANLVSRPATIWPWYFGRAASWMSACSAAPFCQVLSAMSKLHTLCGNSLHRGHASRCLLHRILAATV